MPVVNLTSYCGLDLKEKINGREPNIAILSQDKAVNKKACCKFNFLSWSRFERKNNDPKIIVTIDEPKNDESISE